MISLGFSGEKALKHKPDVTQRLFGVPMRSNFAWGATFGMLNLLQILVSFHACNQTHRIQPGTSG
jgi:hypothetical protein